MHALLGFALAAVAWLVYQGDTEPDGLVMQISSLFPYADKLGHMLVWGCLGALANAALRFRRCTLLGITTYLGSVLVFGLAFGEEMSQYFFPHRHVELADLAADALGIILLSRLAFALHAARAPAAAPEASAG